MQTFALIALGLLAGILFAASILSTSVLAYLSWKTNRQYEKIVTLMKDTALVTQQLVHRVDSAKFERNARTMSQSAEKLKSVAEYFHALYTTTQSRPIGQPDDDTGKFPEEEYASENEISFGDFPPPDEKA